MAEKPAVLVIGPTPPPYHGVAIVTKALLNSDLRSHFNVAHLDLSDRRGIAFVDHPDLHDVVLFLKQWARLLSTLIRERPRVVYLPISQSAVGFLRDSLLIWPSYLWGGHIVLHLHGGHFRIWYESCGRMMKAYVRRVLKPAKRVIVLEESLKTIFRGLVDDGKISVVPNGVGWDKREPSMETFPKRRKHRVLYLSTVNRQKGALVLLAAIPLVERVRSDVEFVFAGPWSSERDRADAERFITEQNLDELVSFIGPVEGEEKQALYMSADLFVFPGIQQEGQPLVVLEAMAAGIPVIFTDRGCLRETVAEAGLEAEIDNPRALAEQILWLVSHPDEMRCMGAAGRNRFEMFYTHDRFIERMTRLFASVAGEAA
jgi:glycosyltransferase involved in cell wall biosynthesis